MVDPRWLLALGIAIVFVVVIITLLGNRRVQKTIVDIEEDFEEVLEDIVDGNDEDTEQSREKVTGGH